MSVNQGKISYSAAVLMSINIMVGAGILYAVGPMTGSAGNVSFLGWPLIALLLCPIVWSLIQAAKLFPGEGGFYHYCTSGINPIAGCVAHWGYLLGYLGTAASVSTVLRDGMATNLGLKLIQEHPIVFNLILASFYTLINTISVSKISKVQSIATLLKLTPILMVIAVMFFYFKSDMSIDMGGIGGLGATVSTVIFAYWGVEACCNIGGLLKDGPQKVGSVILVGFIVTVT
ncbi:MAG: APC family permease, partial [Parachlamydiaceae bacterium]|nr:APC family permease [Parachlamydiaceae bacterium]